MMVKTLNKNKTILLKGFNKGIRCHAVERVKNNVLLKCSTLDDEVISKDLVEIINYGIYHFAEGLMSLINDLFSIQKKI